ncbi:hypothetical protein D9615_008403 [Tricholomella constricta]|uniref:FAD/NAD(P)-binding domain-containing protein n=1 Tax=Tricholomella constricta TaxID=117010 RepID=A0A8H5HDQ0_9AGAR|nr:hypothetical protein D9615_008403 [Tricholomella constricta]
MRDHPALLLSDEEFQETLKEGDKPPPKKRKPQRRQQKAQKEPSNERAQTNEPCEERQRDNEARKTSGADKDMESEPYTNTSNRSFWDRPNPHPQYEWMFDPRMPQEWNAVIASMRAHEGRNVGTLEQAYRNPRPEEVSEPTEMNFPAKKVTIVHGNDRILNDAYPEKFRKDIERRLQLRGVELVLGDIVPEDAATNSVEKPITTRNGKVLTPDLVLTTQYRLYRCIPGRGRPRPSGFVPVEPTFQIPGHPRIFAAGDIAVRCPRWDSLDAHMRAADNTPATLTHRITTTADAELTTPQSMFRSQSLSIAIHRRLTAVSHANTEVNT